MPRIAIDSNVLVSALHFGGTPEALLLLANEGRVELFVSPFILAETPPVAAGNVRGDQDRHTKRMSGRTGKSPARVI